MKKLLYSLAGLGAGIINGLLGAGGGMLIVPILNKIGLNQNESHATSIAVILPLSVFSAILYLVKGHFTISESLIFLPFGVIGAIIGALLLPKLPEKALRKTFGVFMIWAAIRMLMR